MSQTWATRFATLGITLVATKLGLITLDSFFELVINLLTTILIFHFNHFLIALA